MFYAEATHPAIIDNDTFNSAQAVLAKYTKAQKSRSKPTASEFTSKIICRYCSKNYKHRTSNGSVG
ncbi:MAG: hypothetical protein RR052_06305 [Oscillospiraceae bacterium]